jgi:hypothetical protein
MDYLAIELIKHDVSNVFALSGLQSTMDFVASFKVSLIRLHLPKNKIDNSLINHVIYATADYKLG